MTNSATASSRGPRRSSSSTGRNSIAVFASHQGRDKAGGYYGPIDHYYPKGLLQPVYVESAGRKIGVKGWKMRGGIPAPAGLSFQPLAATKASPAFFETTFAAKPPSIGANPILACTATGLSRGTMFINGRCVGRYPETVKYDSSQETVGLYLPECWFSPTGQNTLVIFDEEGQPPSQVRLQIEKAASREVIAVSEPADRGHVDRAASLSAGRPGKGRRQTQPGLGQASDGFFERSRPPGRATSTTVTTKRSGRPPAFPRPGTRPGCRSIWEKLPCGGLRVRRLAVPRNAVLVLHRRIGRRHDVDHAGRPAAFAQRQGAASSRTAVLVIPLNNAKHVRYIRLTLVNVLEPRLDRIGIGEFRVWGEGLH